MYKKAGLFILISLLILLSLAPLVSNMLGEPTIAVAVRSWSMEPVLTRGDLVFLWPTGDNFNYQTGQVIAFRAEESRSGNWVMHRIVGGDKESGFITRGDASSSTDQEKNYPPIEPEWIAGIAIPVGGFLLKIPYAGNLVLFFGENMENPYLLTVFLALLALLLLWNPKDKKAL